MVSNNNGGNVTSTGQFDHSGYFGWINGGITQIQLDIVGFLAVLGEGSTLANSQVAALSYVTFLPRLLPAPQALLRPSRPNKLEPHTGYTTAVRAGNYRGYINHVGHVVVDCEKAKPYTVRVVKVTRKHDAAMKPEDDKDKPTTASEKDSIKAKQWGPLFWTSIVGFSLFIILLAFAVRQNDGMAFLSIILLSFLSTLVGIGNKWTLHLPRRLNRARHTPPGDVVIRYPKGSFLIVQCHEDVARELYFAPEDLDYFIKDNWQYRIISLVGTLMLMFGVLFLGNAQVFLQLGIAGAYIIMNVLYWLVAALPNKLHWDTTNFEVEDQCILPEDELPKSCNKYLDENETFTQALWKAIVVTKDTSWIAKSAAAPEHPAWDDWLHQAKSEAKKFGSREVDVAGKRVVVWELPTWNPQEALDACFSDHREEELEKEEC